jgi:hypothetical protein
MGSDIEFSAKITHSVCLNLEALGYMPGDFLEEVDLTPEKAFDPESWIEAETVEQFLALVTLKVPHLSVKSIALKEPDLNGWGVLNQVLKILKSSLEIYTSPQNYLSYFVKPLNGFVWIEKTNENTVFQASLSSEDFPLVTDYLSGALEVVSEFVEADEDSSVFWTGNTVSVEWGEKEEFQSVPKTAQVYEESVGELDSHQEKLVQSVRHLEDYFLRSRQLISLIKAESGKKRWFKKALQRLDWENLEDHHQKTVDDLINLIKKSNKSVEPVDELSLEEDFQLKLQ